MFTRRSWVVILAAAGVVLGMLLPVTAVAEEPGRAETGQRIGIPPGLQHSNPNLEEECGFLINLRSWPALEKFFTGDHPPGQASGSQANSPEMTKVFSWHLVQLFNIPVDPCP